MLEGVRGDVGVDGSSEVNGDDGGSWELSSARTNIAGVPQVLQSAKDLLRL